MMTVRFLKQHEDRAAGATATLVGHIARDLIARGVAEVPAAPARKAAAPRAAKPKKAVVKPAAAPRKKPAAKKAPAKPAKRRK